MPLVSTLPRSPGHGESAWHDLRSSMGIVSCMEDTLGRAAKTRPPLLADRRRRIVYGRGIPYSERLHASRESALWHPRNAQHGVNRPTCLTHRVCVIL